MISIKQFNSIKKNCDFIIKKSQNYFLIANNSLNIIKGHQFHLSSFEKNILTYLQSLILNSSKLMIELILSLKIVFNKKIFIKKKIDTLLICNLINIKDLNQKDFIYGELEEDFKKKDISYFKILINHTNFSNEYVEKLIKNKKNISILNFKNNYFIYNLKVIFILISLFLFFFFKGIFFLNTYYLFIALDFINPATKNNLNLLKNFKEKTKYLNYNNIILPYEGYSWERLILMQAHDNGIKKRIGYNFSAISKYQHSLFRKLEKKFEPDIIFTVGSYSKKLFEKKTNIPTHILGSVRRLTKMKYNLKKSKYINFLILPEGIISECKKLFNFSIICAKEYPLINFTWRLHPSMKFENVLKKINLKKNLIPNNIIMSKRSFSKDISISNYCIYRGSTSVITAIQNDIYPLYYNSNEQINIDPTFDLKTWKAEINNIKDFNDFMFSRSKIVNKKVKDKNIAKNFAANYFQKMETKKLLNILKN